MKNVIRKSIMLYGAHLQNISVNSIEDKINRTVLCPFNGIECQNDDYAIAFTTATDLEI